MFRKHLKSDVPVTSRIGWRSYQEHLSVRELFVRVLTPELQVMTTDAVVEFTVAGSLSPHFHGESRWRPLIESLHISERFAGETGSVAGDIVIVPVVGIRCDKRYDNQPVEFRVTVQHRISSYCWDRNRYRVTCGHIQQSFEIIQFNKDGVLHNDDVA
jgi:hypothetical protein